MLMILYLFFGYITSYVGYCIGYSAKRTPDSKHTTAPPDAAIQCDANKTSLPKELRPSLAYTNKTLATVRQKVPKYFIVH